MYTVLGQVIYRIGASDLLYYRPPSVECTVLGQVIYRIGASDLLYYNPPFGASNLPYWGK